MNRLGGDPLTRSIRHWGFLTLTTMMLFGVGLATTWVMFREVVNESNLAVDTATTILIAAPSVTSTAPIIVPPLIEIDPAAITGTTTETIPDTPSTTPTVTVPGASPTTTTSSPITTVPITIPVPIVLTVAEQSLTAATNSLRVDVGLSPVALDATLDAYAGNWAMHMATTGAISHSDINTLLDGWTIVGENVASSTSVELAINALVASPSHYAVIVNPAFTEIGVGVVLDGDGTMWVTQVFAGDILPVTTLGEVVTTTTEIVTTTTVTILPVITPPQLHGPRHHSHPPGPRHPDHPFERNHKS